MSRKQTDRATGTPRITFDTVRELARHLPGIEEGTSYGTPALKVSGKLFVRLKEDAETIVLRTDAFERTYLLRSDPQVFFITEHYRDYPWVLVNLTKVAGAQLAELLEGAWRRVAPKRLVSAYEAAESK